MAKEVELSTVEAVRSIRNLREEIKLLGKAAGLSGREVQQLGKPITQLAKDVQRAFGRIAQLEKQVHRLTEANRKLKQAGDAEAAVKRRQAESTRKLKQATDDLIKSQKRQEADQIKIAKTLGLARRQFIALSGAMHRAGTQDKTIRQLGREFENYIRVITTAKIGSVEFAAAQEQWKFAMEQARQAMKSQKADIDAVAAAAKRHNQRAAEAAKMTSTFTTTMRNLGSAAIFAVGPLSGVGARLVAFTAIAQRVGAPIAAISAGLAAMVVGLIKLVKALVETELRLDATVGTLRAALGSIGKANEEFKFASETAAKFGLDLGVATSGLAKLQAAARGTALEGEGARKIFVALSTAATALRLSTEQQEGALRALIQMISKGTVQAEELRGQLGERIPGAFQDAGRAMGVTTAQLGDMLKRGEVISEDFLPKLAEEWMKAYSPEAAEAAENLAASQRRFALEVQQTLEVLNRYIPVAEAYNELLDTGAALLDRFNTRTLREELQSLSESASDSNSHLVELVDSPFWVKWASFLGDMEGFGDKVASESRKAIAAQREYFETILANINNLEGREFPLPAIPSAPIGSTAGLFRPDIFGAVPSAEAERIGPMLKDFMKFEVPDSLKELREELTMLGATELRKEIFALDQQLVKVIEDINNLEKPEGISKELFDAFKAAKVEEAKEAVAELNAELEHTMFNIIGANVGNLIPPDARDKIGGTISDVEQLSSRLLELAVLREPVFEMGITMGQFLATGASAAADAVDKLGGAIDDLSLEEANKRMTDLRNKIEQATESINKQIEQQELVNEFTAKMIGAEDEIVKRLKIELQVRQQHPDAAESLIQKLIQVRLEGEKINGDLDKEIRKREALFRLGQSAGKKGVAERMSKFDEVGTIGIEEENKRLLERGSQRDKVAEELRDLERANAVLHQRIAGNKELADQMEARFELMKKFPDLTTRELQDLQRQLELNKELTNVLKEQEELAKVRRELAEDFASVIGNAFEDAIINGEKLSDVMQALLDDINRIILRVLVTKPLENFLTGLLTGEDPTGSKAGPGGTPFFGGVFGNLFSSSPASGGGGSVPGPHGEISAATQAATAMLNKLAEASSTAAGTHEGLASKAITLITEKTFERAATTTVTSAMFELKLSAMAASEALQALVVAAAGGGGSFGPFVPTSVGGILGSLPNTVGGLGSFGGSNPFEGGFSGNPHFQHGGRVTKPSGMTGTSTLRGDEVPAVLHVGEKVLTKDQAESSGGTVVHLTQNIVTPTPHEFRRSARSNARLGARAIKSGFGRR